jgi:hypothetical protein
MATSQAQRSPRTRPEHKGRGKDPERRGMSTRSRVLIFAIVCVVAVAASVFSFLRGRGDATHTGVATAVGAPLRSVGTTPKLLFRSTALDKNFGTLAAVPLESQKSARRLTPLQCERVDFVGQRGICLTQDVQPLALGTEAVIFDSRFHKLHTVELPGLASRTRMSSDGRYAATTTFVHGDSYADAGFSTRTSIIDMAAGSVVLDLEKLEVTKDGESFQSVDFNYWGVTFVKNSQHFYATLGTGGETYLIDGNLDTEKARVLRSGVECPSLSPDGTRIAFKRRNPGTLVTWGISVLDLATLKDHPLSETRNVDDQVEWLDDQTVIYGLPQDAGDVNAAADARPGAPVLGSQASIQTNTWAVPADGKGTPKELIAGAWSTIPVRA